MDKRVWVLPLSGTVEVAVTVVGTLEPDDIATLESYWPTLIRSLRKMAAPEPSPSLPGEAKGGK